MNQPIKDRLIIKGYGPCPDCGEDANVTTSQAYHYNGEVLDPGKYITIDCPNCDYYEFYYDGPDV